MRATVVLFAAIAISSSAWAQDMCELNFTPPSSRTAVTSSAADFSVEPLARVKVSALDLIAKKRLLSLKKLMDRIATADENELLDILEEVKTLVSKLGDKANPAIDPLILATMANPTAAKSTDTFFARNPGYYLVHLGGHESYFTKRFFQLALNESHLERANLAATMVFQYGSFAHTEIVSHVAKLLAAPQKLNPIQLRNLLLLTNNLFRSDFAPVLQGQEFRDRSALTAEENEFLSKYWHAMFFGGDPALTLKMTQKEHETTARLVSSLPHVMITSPETLSAYLTTMAFIYREDLPAPLKQKLKEIRDAHPIPDSGPVSTIDLDLALAQFASVHVSRNTERSGHP